MRFGTSTIVKQKISIFVSTSACISDYWLVRLAIFFDDDEHNFLLNVVQRYELLFNY